MRVALKGGDDWQRKHARGFAKWYGDKYLPFVHEEILLRIHIIPDREDHVNVAECECCDSEEDPRRFLITLCTTEETSKRSFIRMIAHEMVHLKQYSLNELTDSDDGTKSVFHRKNYDLDMDYWEQPWEIEAHGREKGLVLKYGEFSGITEEVSKACC
jgi:hypothetical protein